jgi:hypothetical protein
MAVATVLGVKEAHGSAARPAGAAGHIARSGRSAWVSPLARDVNEVRHEAFRGIALGRRRKRGLRILVEMVGKPSERSRGKLLFTRRERAQRGPPSGGTRRDSGGKLACRRVAGASAGRRRRRHRGGAVRPDRPHQAKAGDGQSGCRESGASAWIHRSPWHFGCWRACVAPLTARSRPAHPNGNGQRVGRRR